MFVRLKYSIFFILLLFFNETISCQISYDTSSIKTDSTRIYKNIEKFSNRSKITKFLHSLLFKPSPPAIKKKQKKPIKSPYSFEGRIIRNIDISILDPFGYSITDTSVKPVSFLQTSGNKLHISTRSFTIQSLLLFKQNMPFDSLLVRESERLIRIRPYVREVQFTFKQLPKNPDSVDISILVLDKWSIIPRVNISNSESDLGITDRNFSGLGNDLNANIYIHKNPNRFAYNASYIISNFYKTYISGKFYYGRDGYGHFNRTLSIDRPFFSPFAILAGGLNFTQQSNADSFQINYPSAQNYFRYNSQDLWLGYAFGLYKSTAEYKRNTNLIAAFRFNRLRFIEIPFNAAEMQNKFFDANMYFVKLGISSRTYVQDRYLFQYGIVEDVPSGKVYSITAGYQKYINNYHRWYIGSRIAYGRYFKWGYAGSDFEFGTFFHKSKAEQGAFFGEINYFTGLLEIGKWRFRQFARSQVTIGFHRFTYDTLTLNGDFGIARFNSSGLSGNKRIILTLQSQLYTPWSLIGFRFGPFVSLSFGTLGDPETGFRESKIYSQIGFGFLLRNENLIINTFQLSFAFYPVIPGAGKNILKFNSFRTYDFGLRDYQINRPGVISYK